MATDTIHKLDAAIGRMGAESDAESESAFRFATRMLAGHDLTWREVGEIVAKHLRAEAATPAQQFETAFSGFGDIFANMRRPTPRADATPPRPRNLHRSGAEVPSEISGLVTIDDTREWKRNGGGTMAVLTITSESTLETVRYTPLVAFSADVIATLRQAQADGRRVIARVRQPSGQHHMPTVTSATAL